MTFSGESNRSFRSKVTKEDNQAFHSIIQQSTTAFLDAYLLKDEDAKEWLNGNGFMELVGERGTLDRDADKTN